MIQDNEGIIVFGAGQMRTGTMSLKLALEHIYKGKCYHMAEAVWNSSHIDLWQKSLEQKKLTKGIAEKLFKNYCCAVDLPVAAFYKDMIELYPNAKVILSVRDPDSWIKSVRETTFVRDYPNFWQNIWFYIIGLRKFWNMIFILYPTCFNRTLQELKNDDILRDCYIEFNESVKLTVPKERLLVFEAKDGWGPLCKFLDVKVPDIEYPKVNNQKDFQKIELYINLYLAGKSVVKVLIPILLVGVGVFYVRRAK